MSCNLMSMGSDERGLLTAEMISQDYPILLTEQWPNLYNHGQTATQLLMTTQRQLCGIDRLLADNQMGLSSRLEIAAEMRAAAGANIAIFSQNADFESKPVRGPQ